MKFTSEDLMKAMGLQVGDRIKINDSIYTVELNDYDEPIYIDEYSKIKFPITDLVNRNYEILPRPKRVGDTLCNGKCAECPLRTTRCEYKQDGNETLYDILDCVFDAIEDDQEIYDLLKARLDKEVE